MKIKSIGSATKRQLDAIFETYNKTFPKSPWSRSYFDSFLFSSKGRAGFFMLNRNNNLCGFILGKKQAGASDEFNLSALWVNKNCRSKGHANALMEKFISETSKKTEKMYLHFRDSNNLQAFYSKFGFINHRIDGQYKNGEPKHYMELKIRRKSLS